MEGAQAHEIGATLLELDMAADDIDDIGPRKQLLNE